MIDLESVGAGDVDTQLRTPGPDLTGGLPGGVPVSDLQVQTGPPPA